MFTIIMVDMYIAVMVLLFKNEVAEMTDATGASMCLTVNPVTANPINKAKNVVNDFTFYQYCELTILYILLNKGAFLVSNCHCSYKTPMYTHKEQLLYLHRLTTEM